MSPERKEALTGVAIFLGFAMFFGSVALTYGWLMAKAAGLQ